jgi:NAD dependent epimerase/dehydratase family enzyme
MFLFLAQHPELKGVYNGVAPHPETNAALTKYIAKALKRPMFLPPVPGFALKLMMGEMGGMLLSDQNISSAKIQEAGFGFKHLHAQDAIFDILR